MSNTNKAKKLWWLWALLGLLVAGAVVAALLSVILFFVIKGNVRRRDQTGGKAGLPGQGQDLVMGHGRRLHGFFLHYTPNPPHLSSPPRTKPTFSHHPQPLSRPRSACLV